MTAMKTETLADAIAITGKEVLDYLDRDAAVPVVTRAAMQGDVSILKVTTKAATKPLKSMVTVVSSEASTNTHTLHANGEVFYDANKSASVTDLVLGTVTVSEGSEALLSHQEHGALVLAPGTYNIGRQREFANEWAYVAD